MHPLPSDRKRRLAASWTHIAAAMVVAVIGAWMLSDARNDAAVEPSGTPEEAVDYTLHPPVFTEGKVETTGTIRIDPTACSKSTDRCIVALNFARIQGGELWTFHNTADLGPEWEELQVFLSAGFQGRVWYEKHPEADTLLIFASEAGEVSFRLTAPRREEAEKLQGVT